MLLKEAPPEDGQVYVGQAMEQVDPPFLVPTLRVSVTCPWHARENNEISGVERAAHRLHIIHHALPRKDKKLSGADAEIGLWEGMPELYQAFGGLEQQCLPRCYSQGRRA